MRAQSKLIDIGSTVVYTTKRHRFLYKRSNEFKRNTLDKYAHEDVDLKEPYDMKLKASHNKGRDKAFYEKRAKANGVGFWYD